MTNTVSFTIQFVDATTQTGTLTVGDWFNGSPVAYNSNGRVTVGTSAFDNVNAGNPRLYSFDIAVTSTTAIESIALDSTSTSSTAAFFALSGTQIVPEPSTVALVLLSLLAGLGASRRRARRIT